MKPMETTKSVKPIKFISTGVGENVHNKGLKKLFRKFKSWIVGVDGQVNKPAWFSAKDLKRVKNLMMKYFNERAILTRNAENELTVQQHQDLLNRMIDDINGYVIGIDKDLVIKNGILRVCEGKPKSVLYVNEERAHVYRKTGFYK